VTILFDEGVPRQLRRLLGRDDITLVDERGWKGVKNGQLLQLAEENNFTVLITADRNLKYQQNLKGRKIAIVVLPYNRRKDMPLLVPSISNALQNIQTGAYVEIPRPIDLDK
jgi:predicted nuclease of predicted toxin-antitoxin system